jgi:hypothetical protein
MEESDGVKGTLKLQVFLHLLLDRSKTRKDIGVRVDDTFRLCGGSGGEDYLDGIGFGEGVDCADRGCG